MIQRLHTSNKSRLSIRSIRKPQQVGMKPEGLWYGIDTSWMDWMKDHGQITTAEKTHTFELEIDPSKLLIIKTANQFKQFVTKFSSNDSRIPFPYPMIDWQKVAEEYSGIEIQKYFREFRYSHKWYYIWDVACGCIWNTDAVVSVKKIREVKGEE